ncbi:MAG TPA: glucose-6-phosphate dehydrogenase [Coriobacteriia bacterium]|nr:glucose-6-phosphate dehydrogenase [Coriobacteriia bacterium]
MSTPHAATILTVFGASGDLMARKIVPALFYLSGKGALPERCAVAGFSRRDWTGDDLRAKVREIVEERFPDVPEEDVTAFVKRFAYVRGEFDDPDAYARLGAHLSAIDRGWELCANKLFYLAVPPEHYRTILGRLAESGLAEPCDDLTGWTRVLVEKPFGDDSRTSQELDEFLGGLFREEQIYRIDHYLAKEMLQGIINFRFTNNLFETSWDRRAIESIEISLLESIGVEKRGRFYDGVGALRDVGQNHLLQMLALVTMDQPFSRGAASIREARAGLLRSLRPLTAEESARASFRAQYAGYREIEGVDPGSDTETFFRLRFEMTGRRWAGVPVTLQAGKRLGEARKEIVVTFRHPHPCLCDRWHHYQNRVTFRLEPVEEIEIEFWAKRPGFDYGVERRTFDFFLYEKDEKTQYVEEYAKLLLDAVDGDQTLFVSTEEVAAMWAFIDPVSRAWRDGAVPLERYAPGSADVTERAAHVLDSPAVRGRVGVAGLGKMGSALALNLAGSGWHVVAYNRTSERVAAVVRQDDTVQGAHSLDELVDALERPRVIWLMLTAGKPVEHTLFAPGGLAELLEAGDVVIDGGNSYFGDAADRAKRLAERGIAFLDCGTSGGPGGARAGACLMVGGAKEEFERLEALFADVALPGGYRFFEGHGAGHFVKMVHNGIEYGMMQAIAEGFQILRTIDFDLDLTAVADIYQHGSVIESRLVGWLAEAFELHGEALEGVSGMVGHTGEGEWTVRTAGEMGLEARVIRAALEFRRESERDPTYAGQVLTALRNRFGGHAL